MSEQATPAQPANGSEPEAGKDKDTKDQRIPYERFEEVNQQKRRAEQERDDLLNKLREFEDAGKSEVERERAARERMEQMNADLTNRITGLEKGSWVRSAALELNFHD